MTKEELLKPRYKVIAGYPHMELDQHGVGDVISPFGMGFVYPEKVKEQYDSFPHLFKKLEWWEERKAEDYPAFLKTKNGEIRKINQIVTEESDEPFYTTEEDELGWYFHQDGVMPATEQEYLEYKKQSTP